MVGEMGLEPTRAFAQRILVEDRGAAPLIKTAFSVSPLRLPIPPLAQGGRLIQCISQISVHALISKVKNGIYNLTKCWCPRRDSNP